MCQTSSFPQSLKSCGIWTKKWQVKSQRSERDSMFLYSTILCLLRVSTSVLECMSECLALQQQCYKKILSRFLLHSSVTWTPSSQRYSCHVYTTHTDIKGMWQAWDNGIIYWETHQLEIHQHQIYILWQRTCEDKNMELITLISLCVKKT